MGDQAGYNSFQKGETALGGGADKRHCDVNAINYKLEVTNCDFKLGCLSNPVQTPYTLDDTRMVAANRLAIEER